MYAMILIFLNPVTSSLASTSVSGYTDESSCNAAASNVSHNIISASNTIRSPILVSYQCIKVRDSS
jgi:hypothetical protein